MARTPRKARSIDGKLVHQKDPRGGAIATTFGLPPKVRGLPLVTALSRQVRFWGIRRTFEAYQKAVQAGIDAGRTVDELYTLSARIERQKVRWEMLDDIREMARREVVLEKMQQEKLLHQEGLELRKARKAYDLAGLEEKILQNNKEAEAERSEAGKIKAQQERENAKGGGKNSIKDTLSGMFDDHKNYELIAEFKKRLVEERGGEDNLTENDKDFIGNMEDYISFTLAQKVQN